MWPAFWLLGGNIDEVGWPRCGEIDVMEGKGRLPDWTSGALHRGPDPTQNRITAAEYRLTSGSFHDAFHVFAVEWEPGRIVWYVDGIRYQTVERTPGDDPSYWPFDQGHSFFIILNLAVGGWFDPPHLPPEEMLPQRLYVDYVRVYRKSGRSPYRDAGVQIQPPVHGRNRDLHARRGGHVFHAHHAREVPGFQRRSP